MSSSLVSTQNLVESPFIIARIGDYTFGHCADKQTKNKLHTIAKVTFPNFMQSIDIVKINGAINTYTLKMIYGITQNDDPNMLEKVFSSVSNSRKIVLSYGDWNAPGYIYKDEEAVITKVVSSVDFKNAQIIYTISCTSSALSLSAGVFSFPAKNAKPSDVLVELLTNKRYGLTNVFRGMTGLSDVAYSKFISRDDKSVQILAKPSTNIIDYISYLVSCMSPLSDSSTSTVKKSVYHWAVYDDINNEYGGAYFRVQRVDKNQSVADSNVYEIDVGYPSANFVTSFSIKTDNTWSMLYDYSESIEMPKDQFRINNDGTIEKIHSPAVTKSSSMFLTTETSKTWWTQVTQFPISASLTIKGLLRPALLMSYVKINTYFYGHKHISSGLYIINKQQDSISSNGYNTTLTLTRVAGDTL